MRSNIIQKGYDNNKFKSDWLFIDFNDIFGQFINQSLNFLSIINFFDLESIKNKNY